MLFTIFILFFTFVFSSKFWHLRHGIEEFKNSGCYSQFSVKTRCENKDGQRSLKISITTHPLLGGVKAPVCKSLVAVLVDEGLNSALVEQGELEDEQDYFD